MQIPDYDTECIRKARLICFRYHACFLSYDTTDIASWAVASFEGDWIDDARVEGPD